MNEFQRRWKDLRVPVCIPGSKFCEAFHGNGSRARAGLLKYYYAGTKHNATESSKGVLFQVKVKPFKFIKVEMMELQMHLNAVRFQVL